MLKFNLAKQDQVREDPTIQEVKVKTTKKTAPITLWKLCRLSDNSTYIDAYHPASDILQEVLGVSDSDVLSVSIDNKHQYVHILPHGIVHNITSTAGEHRIEPDGYVAQLTVSADAVWYISGHVSELYVGDYGQVYLQAGAYVDRLVVQRNGFARLSKDAKVYALFVEQDGTVEADINASVNTTTVHPGGKLGHSYIADKVAPVSVYIDFKARQDIVAFCKKATEEYNEKHYLQFQKLHLGNLANCRPLIGIKSDNNEDNWQGVAFDSFSSNFMDPVIIQQCIKESLGDVGVVALVNGKDELTLRHPCVDSTK